MGHHGKEGGIHELLGLHLRIKEASDTFKYIADLEEEAHTELLHAIR